MSEQNIAARDMAIVARKLGKSYGVSWAVRGVDLDVAPGESVALFGANGAGKSTLVRLLATLTPPSVGALLILGQDATRPGPALRGGIGVLGHQSYLYGELTAIENLELYARLYGVAEASKRVQIALESVGLAGAAHKRVREFSRGMGQRLGLARANLHSPAVLLLDEPDSGLDADGVLMLERILAEGRSRGQATVLATHGIELGLRLCGRAIVLAKGKIAYSAPTAAHGVDEWHRLYYDVSSHRL